MSNDFNLCIIFVLLVLLTPCSPHRWKRSGLWIVCLFHYLQPLMSVVNFSHPNKDKHKAQGPRGGCDCSASSRQTKDVYLISHLMRSSLGSSLPGVKSKPTILAPVSLITYNNKFKTMTYRTYTKFYFLQWTVEQSGIISSFTGVTL